MMRKRKGRIGEKGNWESGRLTSHLLTSGPVGLETLLFLPWGGGRGGREGGGGGRRGGGGGEGGGGVVGGGDGVGGGGLGGGFAVLAVVCQVEGGVDAGWGRISLVLLCCHIVCQSPQHVTGMTH